MAALIMNNDFGKTYEAGLQDCAADGGIEIAGRSCTIRLLRT